jgi:hypothetical protein
MRRGVALGKLRSKLSFSIIHLIGRFDKHFIITPRRTGMATKSAAMVSIRPDEGEGVRLDLVKYP